MQDLTPTKDPVTDAKSQQTVYTYNNMNRAATRQDPLLNTETYTYDNNGNVATVTDRKSQVTTYTYDAVNRRTKSTFQDGTSTNYIYDAGNRITQVQEKDASNTVTATITRTYDDLDRLTNETTAQGSVTYVYDNASRRTSMTVAGQTAVTYTYDNANRLTQVQQGTNTVTIGYDDADRRTSLTLTNGNRVTYAYDVASQLTSLTYKQASTVVGDLTYTYDLAGNRIKTGGSFSRTTIPPALTTVSYNANNQQTIFGTNTLTYDLNGNLATVTDSGTTQTNTWNVRNQLTGISVTGFSASFTYDSFGRRTGKTINGTTTNFVYDGLNPVQEKSGGVVTANLLTGLGIDEFFTRTDGVGASTLLTDALGSTVALGDNTGTLQTQYTYEPFGYATQIGLANTNSYKYTGREDDGSGLMYYRARYYHPRLQRFISEDPIGFAAGDMNLYAYVENDPVNLADPWGLQAAIPFPGAPFPLPPPPIAIPGSPQNQQAVQATAEALRQLQNSVGALGDSLEDLLIMMAQRGQQNIDNEFSRQARLQPDPCGWLRQQYNQAQDPITRLKIKAAQKFLGCRKSRAGKDCE